VQLPLLDRIGGAVNVADQIKGSGHTQTDFSSEPSCQAIAVAQHGRLVAAGGEDRITRIFSFPALKLLA